MNIFLILLILVFFFDLLAIKTSKDKWRLITKSLLMPLLICYYIMSSIVDYKLIIALIFCFLGDVFLLSKKELYFKLGVVSFLKAHILYVVVFLSGITLVPYYYCFLIFPFIIGFLIFFNKIGKNIVDLRLPIIVYAIIIFTMSYSALLRFYTFSGVSFWLPFIGSILFISSDTSLAYNMFVKKREGSTIFVMSTYVMAQILIVVGFIK